MSHFSLYVFLCRLFRVSNFSFVSEALWCFSFLCFLLEAILSKVNQKVPRFFQKVNFSNGVSLSLKIGSLIVTDVALLVIG